MDLSLTSEEEKLDKTSQTVQDGSSGADRPFKCAEKVSSQASQLSGESRGKWEAESLIDSCSSVVSVSSWRSQADFFCGNE